MPTSQPAMPNGKPLSAIWRCYIYALHGYATEIMFTAAWDFVVHRNWKLHGNTSVWIMPIYGSFGLVMEQLYLPLTKRGVPLAVRGLFYLVLTYLWEFSTGFLLKQFGMCPWDYTDFDGDFMGLIALEYAPLWYIGSLYTDRLLFQHTLQLYWGPIHEDFIPESNNVSKKKTALD